MKSALLVGIFKELELFFSHNVGIAVRLEEYCVYYFQLHVKSL